MNGTRYRSNDIKSFSKTPDEYVSIVLTLFATVIDDFRDFILYNIIYGPLGAKPLNNGIPVRSAARGPDSDVGRRTKADALIIEHRDGLTRRLPRYRSRLGERTAY